MIIFCSDYFDLKKVDEDYQKEYEVAKKSGFEVGIINLEALVQEGNSHKAVQAIKKSEEGRTAIYRGWMLKPKQYEALYQELLKKNIRLINSPKEYKHCHHFPESYPSIEGMTPKTTWLSMEELKQNESQLEDMLSTFGDKPLIVKDYVKSRKHDWETACFIPNASNTQKAKEIIQNFIRLQGGDLNEGIVLREFVNLEFLTKHEKSGMPLSREFRVFFLNKQIVQILHYWDEGDYGDELPEMTPFLEVARKMESNFFTMDVAKLQNGEWTIIELGDGQVSGLPENINYNQFYDEMKRHAN